MPKISKKKTYKTKKGKGFFQSPKGMHDIIPVDQPFWEKIRQATKNTAEFYGFSRIDTPLVEVAEIFEKGLGGETDVVEKQMYFVKAKGGDRLVLRPEGTAPIVRAYFENGLSRMGQPVKLYYIGPMFRHEQPQAGRYRQFHQAGFEILGGENDPLYDAQAALACFRILEELKVKNKILHINSIGCNKCRQAYQKRLEIFYKKNMKRTCRDCQRRINSNILRVLDCKEEKCQEVKAGAPIILDFICNTCKEHFRKVLEYLDEVKVPYFVDAFLVRGLDYYNRTVFEIFVEGFSFAVASGGRYDYLGEMLKFGKLNATGGSVGLERVVEITKSLGKISVNKTQAKVFLIHIGEEARKRSLALIEDLKKAGVKVGESLGKESLKSQFRAADKEGAQFALILGQKEVFEESIILRDMNTGAQENIPLAKIVEEMKKKLH